MVGVVPRWLLYGHCAARFRDGYTGSQNPMTFRAVSLNHAVSRRRTDSNRCRSSEHGLTVRNPGRLVAAGDLQHPHMADASGLGDSSKCLTGRDSSPDRMDPSCVGGRPALRRVANLSERHLGRGGEGHRHIGHNCGIPALAAPRGGVSGKRLGGTVGLNGEGFDAVGQIMFADDVHTATTRAVAVGGHAAGGASDASRIDAPLGDVRLRDVDLLSTSGAGDENSVRVRRVGLHGHGVPFVDVHMVRILTDVGFVK